MLSQESGGSYVETLGQGDVLIVMDAEDDLINDIDEMMLDKLAAGCTAPSLLGASIRFDSSSFEIGPKTKYTSKNKKKLVFEI